MRFKTSLLNSTGCAALALATLAFVSAGPAISEEPQGAHLAQSSGSAYEGANPGENMGNTNSSNDGFEFGATTEAIVPIDSLENPVATLENTRIESLDGQSVGKVAEVNIDEQGEPVELKAKVGGFLGIGAQTVAFTPDQLSYNEAEQVLVASLTKEQIKELPEDIAMAPAAGSTRDQSQDMAPLEPSGPPQP